MSRCVLFAAGLLVLLLTAQAGYAQSFDQSVYFQLQAHHSGKCLDVRDISLNNGGRLQQWDCAGVQKNQLWMLAPTGAGTYRIASANSAKCADIINASTTNGTYVQQWDCNLAWNQYNQVFNFTASPNSGYWRITPTNATGTKCLDVEGVSQANGANIQIWDCGPAGNTNQDWLAVPYTPRTTLTNLKLFGYAFSVSNGRWTNMSDHGNMGEWDYPNDLPYFSQLPTAAGAGVKAMMIAPPNTLFIALPRGGNDEWATTNSSGQFVDGGLRTDYVNYWNTVMKPQIAPYASSISMFYLYDEPYWVLGHYYGFPDSEINDMLTRVASLLKSDFPNIKIGLIEGDPRAGSVVYPSDVDYVGFDCYGCDPSHYTANFNAMKANLLPTQSLLLVPYGFVTHSPDTNPSHPFVATQAEQDYLVSQADYYLNIALNEPRVAGMIVYASQSSYDAPTNSTFIGTWDMPSVKLKWLFLMRVLGFGAP
jgi:hypothetical protein